MGLLVFILFGILWPQAEFLTYFSFSVFSFAERLQASLPMNITRTNGFKNRNSYISDGTSLEYNSM